MPTLADISNVQAPQQTDGISILPILIGGEQKQHDHFYWGVQEGANEKGFRQAARRGKWKAVRYGDSYKTELYDLEADVYETKDLSSQNPEIVEEMNSILRSESVVN